MTSQPGKQTITIHVMTNISRSNQAMKFVQLMEYMRDIFLEKSYIKCGEKLFADPFLKKQN